MRNQKGFTLIELIIVIVVLGILAVTAAPQFMNFSSDARTSTVQGLLGSTKAASEMVNAKFQITGAPSGSVIIDNEDTAVNVVAGYPAATTDDGITEALDISADWSAVVATAAEGDVQVGDLLIYPTGIEESGDPASECYVVYRQAVPAVPADPEDPATPVDFAKPVIFAVTDGC